MKLTGSCNWAVLGLIALALCSACAVAQEQEKADAQSIPVPKNQPEAQALVRSVIQHQMDADAKGGGPSFMYVLKENGRHGVVTKGMVETQEGIIARLVAIDGKPLTPEQRNAEEDRLNKLLSDPQARAEKARKQKEDDQRSRKMVDALPDAFLYDPDGTAPGPRGELVRLKFHPNPNYDPPSRELQVFQGMEGHMIVDPRAKRLVEINAHLFRDVNFGWGILGHLDKGGEFQVQQSDVTGDNDWEITKMHLKFDGKAVIFKSIHIRDEETADNFRVVPKGLTFAQGVELLRKQETAVAEKK